MSLNKRAVVSQEALTLFFLVLALIAGLAIAYFVSGLRGEGFHAKVYAKDLSLIAEEIASLDSRFTVRVVYVLEPGYSAKLGEGTVVVMHDRGMGTSSYLRRSGTDVLAAQNGNIVLVRSQSGEPHG